MKSNFSITYLILAFISVIFTSCESDITNEFGESNAFIKFYGGAGDDIGNDIIETESGDFVLLGTSTTFATNRNNTDIYVVKTDNFGNETWRSILGDSTDSGTNEIASQIEPTQDGGFIIIGTKETTDGNKSDIYVNKIDSAGIEQWEVSIERPNTLEVGNSIRPTLDGGFIIVGSTTDDTGGVQFENAAGLDMFIAKLNALGVIEWERTYGFEDPKPDTGTGILEANDGDFIWFGTNRITENGTDFSKMRVVRSNNIGNLRWDRFYDSDTLSNENIIAEDIQKDSPGFILAGTAIASDGKEEVFVVKIDEDGSEIWQTTFVGEEDEEIKSVTPLMGGGYAIAGVANPPGNEDGSFIIVYLLDGQGSIQSIAKYGRLQEGIDFANAVIQTKDGSFAIAGSVAFETNEMMCLIKIAPTEFTPVN